MINSVRNTVLSVLNKNNYGYISPSDFNLFAKQAQLDIFENYFYNYNYQINKENARQSGTGYADIKKGYEEVLDFFSKTVDLTLQGGNTFTVPSDYYLINKVLYAGALQISQSKITLLQNSPLTSPSDLFPAYTLEGNLITAYPATINTQGDVVCQYVRYPADPKWTYADVPTSTGEPLFDPTASDYKDFELPLSDEPTIVLRILEYAGLSIRELQVVQAATQAEARESTSEQ